ncbi:hypothetical protein ABE488_12775 [Luteimonas sp. TWI662]|uniref:hypothetical protein n=1 Tax=Luteimonas sp. TWI662 TaxID=3136789 RepID=UPI0032086C5C
MTIALCAVVMMSGCHVESSIAPADVRLARTPAPIETHYFAPLRGTVTVERECLSLESTDRGTVVLVYPHDHRMGTVDGRLSVLNANGESVLTDGRPVEIGGALLDAEPAARTVSAEDRALCEGPFFLVLPQPARYL